MIFRLLITIQITILCFLNVSIFIPNIGAAGDVYLIIKDKETQAFEEEAQTYKKVIHNIDPSIHVEIARLNSLDQLPHALSQLSSDNKIMGITLLGHGNPYVFGFRFTEKYNGGEVAKIFWNSISRFNLSENFSVYFNTCRTGAYRNVSDGFQNYFVRDFSIYLGMKVPRYSLDVISHLNYSISPSEPRDFTPMENLMIQHGVFQANEFLNPLSRIITGASIEIVHRLWPVYLMIAGRLAYPELVDPHLSLLAFAWTALNFRSLDFSYRHVRKININENGSKIETSGNNLTLLRQSVCESLLRVR